MNKFVFEADIIVPRMELKRHRFELDWQQMEQLLAQSGPVNLHGALSAADVCELIDGKGEFVTKAVLDIGSDARARILRSVAAQAWLNDIPWTITQCSAYGTDDPRFDKLVSATMQADEQER
jgi:hypothetical protein